MLFSEALVSCTGSFDLEEVAEMLSTNRLEIEMIRSGTKCFSTSTESTGRVFVLHVHCFTAPCILIFFKEFESSHHISWLHEVFRLVFKSHRIIWSANNFPQNPCTKSYLADEPRWLANPSKLYGWFGVANKLGRVIFCSCANIVKSMTSRIQSPARYTSSFSSFGRASAFMGRTHRWSLVQSQVSSRSLASTPRTPCH